MREYTKSEIAEIAERCAVPVPDDWTGPGPVWPLINGIMEDGSVVFIKLDGERTVAIDNGPYSVMAMGGRMGEQEIRGDFDSLDEALCYLIGNYYEGFQ